MVYRHDFDHPSYHRSGIGGYRDIHSQNRTSSRGLLAVFGLMAAIFLVLTMVAGDPPEQARDLDSGNTLPAGQDNPDQ